MILWAMKSINLQMSLKKLKTNRTVTMNLSRAVNMEFDIFSLILLNTKNAHQIPIFPGKQGIFRSIIFPSFNTFCLDTVKFKSLCENKVSTLFFSP